MTGSLSGDSGGNLFPIIGANQSELHAFWDSGAGLWEDDLVRPMNAGKIAHHCSTPRGCYSYRFHEQETKFMLSTTPTPGNWSVLDRWAVDIMQAYPAASVSRGKLVR